MVDFLVIHSVTIFISERFSGSKWDTLDMQLYVSLLTKLLYFIFSILLHSLSSRLPAAGMEANPVSEICFLNRRIKDVVSWQPGSGCHSPSKVSRELQPAPWEGASQQEHRPCITPRPCDNQESSRARQE